MIIAPNRTKNPIFQNEGWLRFFKYSTVQAPNEVWSMLKEIVTLAYIDSVDENGEDIRIVAGTVFNPEDKQWSRAEGRCWAADRLSAYLIHGIQKKHKNGRSAAHFVLQLNKEDIKDNQWKLNTVNFMLSKTWFEEKKAMLLNLPKI
jgi:hypothetical protein